MFDNSINEIFWDVYMSEFADFIDLGESKAPQNEQVEILQPQIFEEKIFEEKIFEDTDGEYVDFVEL